MLLNQDNRNALYRMSTTQDYVQGALRKKQLIAHFVEHYKESHDNGISIIFKSHVTKFDQKQYFRLFFSMLAYMQGGL